MFSIYLVALPITLVARVAELVDARDLKSLGLYRPCRFDSGHEHQLAMAWHAKVQSGDVAQLDRAADS